MSRVYYERKLDSLKSLQEVRKDIDRVDGEIKKLFEERMHLADNVASVKALTEDKIYKPERESDIIKKLSKGVKPEILLEYISFVKKIIGLSRKYQYGRTLELLEKNNGIGISYKDEASKADTIIIRKKDIESCLDIAKSVFGDDCKIIYADDNDEFMHLLDNSNNNETSNCSNVIGVGILETKASGFCDRLNELITNEGYFINKCILLENEQDFKKIVMFSKNLVVLEDDNRLSLMFTCEDCCGSLSTTLSVIADYGINITGFTTHYHTGNGGEPAYRFYVELEASFTSRSIQTLLFQLQSETKSLQVLGSYKVENVPS